MEISVRCALCQSLKELDCWLSSPEMAFLSINGGIEGTIRNRLMYQIQRLLPDKVVRSEKKVKGRKPDIEILHKTEKDEKVEPRALALIEIKHNFLFYSGGFKRVEEDIKKWSKVEPPIPLFCIQIIKSFVQTFSKVWPPRQGPPEASAPLLRKPTEWGADEPPASFFSAIFLSL